ncbi:AGAP006275-PA-like protein [Anopheles sinensis]|uniref:AGAP006275-PA-like protein n=1 Tax=Anopheles sinensis TaxID=74873 RepID=A0A084WKF2_ANOSI|nr:AGAP006275-PA-like protein [Anopheles sinensis]
MIKVLLVSALGVLALLAVARGRSDSPSEEMIEVDELIEDFSTWCISSRREQARLEVIRYMALCFTSQVEEETFMPDFYSLSNKTRTTFFPRVINEMKQCAVRKLSVCQAPELVSLYDRFHNDLIRDTPCREIMANVSDTNQTKIENNAANEE